MSEKESGGESKFLLSGKLESLLKFQHPQDKNEGIEATVK